MSDTTIVITDPPESRCGTVKRDGTYLRGVGGGGWGGGSGGVRMLGTAIWPARGDASGVVTQATKRTVPRVVAADAVLANAPEPDWLAAQSKKNWLKGNWEKFDERVFGMPARRRLDNGFLAGITSIDEAASRLQALTFNGQHATVGRRLQILSRLTVDNEAVHPVSLDAWRSYKEGQPFLVLARMHEIVGRNQIDLGTADAALAVMQAIAPEDMFWRQLERAMV